MNSGKDGSPAGKIGSPAGNLAGGLDNQNRLSNAGSLGDFEGTLVVDLVKARNLIKADIMGKSDPYAVLKFGKQKEKTNTLKNTLEPQWDHQAVFNVPDSGADKILVEVFDADKLGKDKSLGKVEVDILDLAADEGRWFPLQGKKTPCLTLLHIPRSSLYKHFYTQTPHLYTMPHAPH